MRSKIAIAGKPGSSANQAPIIVEHRSAPRDRLAPSVWASMRRTLLAGAPGDAQSGGEALEIRRRFRLVRAVQPASIDPLAEFSLGGTDFGDQHDRIGDGLQPPQLRLSLNDGWNRFVCRRAAA
jgi:hypothetical protein